MPRARRPACYVFGSPRRRHVLLCRGSGLSSYGTMTPRPGSRGRSTIGAPRHVRRESYAIRLWAWRPSRKMQPWTEAPARVPVCTAPTSVGWFLWPRLGNKGRPYGCLRRAPTPGTVDFKGLLVIGEHNPPTGLVAEVPWELKLSMGRPHPGLQMGTSASSTPDNHDQHLCYHSALPLY